MRREELVMSGCSTPTPAQNSFRPPPEPVLSMTGVLKLAGLAELLGYNGCERINGGRTDDADLVAGLSGRTCDRDAGNDCDPEKLTIHG